MCEISALSSIYEAKPFGISEQDNYLNAVIKLKTSFELHDLFKFIKNIEVELGRKQTFKWGPREIDLDLLFYDEVILKDENITIPHPGIHQRDFVLIPLQEIEPGFFHPVLKRKISDISIPESEGNIIRIFDKKLHLTIPG